MEWQPIETAPKDLTLCLVGFWDDCPSLPQAYWHARIAAYQRIDFNENPSELPAMGWVEAGWGGCGVEYVIEPTHWMPLPNPPKMEE